MEKFILVPHDKYQKLSAPQKGNAPHLAAQFHSQHTMAPPPGLPYDDIRAQQGKELSRDSIEMQRDKKLEQEVSEISDTESDSSGAATDWIRVWQEVQK